MRLGYGLFSEFGSISAAILSFEEVMSMQKRITVLKRGIGKNGSATMACCPGGTGNAKK